MPTVILRPAAIGNYNDNTIAIGVGATKMACADTGDPVTHDDDTTYLTTSGAGVNKLSFTVLAAGSPLIGNISAYGIGDRHTRPAANTLGSHVRVNGVDGVQQNAVVTVGAGYETHTTSLNPLKSGSVPLQGTDIKYSDGNFEQVFVVQASSAGMRITSFWGSLTYDPPLGGFTALIAQFLGPVLGAGLLLRDMPRLIALFNATTRGELVIHGREALALYRELRAYRAPAYAFLGA